jgi:mRNA-degrading endonuclease toxin of MazEF toxin-antitoxin module
MIVISQPCETCVFSASKSNSIEYDTELLIDQIRTISNARFMFRYCTVPSNTLKKVEDALRLLIAR